MPGSVDDPPPAEVADRLLWRLAVTVIDHHQPDPATPGRCAHPICYGATWPCPPHQRAVRAEQAARGNATTATGPATVTPARPHPRVPRRPWATRWAAVTDPPHAWLVALDATESAVLGLLRHGGPATVDDLAAHLRLTPATTGDALASLRLVGLATQLTHP